MAACIYSFVYEITIGLLRYLISFCFVTLITLQIVY